MEHEIAAGICVDAKTLIRLGDKAKRVVLDFSAGARSILAGAHLSKFRGRGMDFAESREYQAGDDVRHIDWRVTARTGKTHTKLFVEERERPVFMIVDFSDSMYFGTRGGFKSVTAAKAATYAAWSVIAGGDRVGGVIATRDKIVDLKPGAGRRGVLKIISALAEATKSMPDKSTVTAPNLFNKSLDHAIRVVHPGSLVLLFSDFYGQDEKSRQLLSRLGKHNDIVACHIIDPLEQQLPGSGKFLVSDGSHTTTLTLLAKREQNRFQRLMTQRQDAVASLVAGLGIPLLPLINNRDVADTLNDAFAVNKRSAGKTSRARHHG